MKKSDVRKKKALCQVHSECSEYALSGVNQYMRVLTENIKDIDNFELKHKTRKPQ